MALQADTYYHIYNRANGNENLFRNDENYYYFLKLWDKYVNPIAGTYAYCLMPNHFHTLIKINEENLLMDFFKKQLKSDLTDLSNLSSLISKRFSNFFNAYAKAYNKSFDRQGSLFNRPFKAKEITSDNYFTNVIFYIHHNPVHHEFTESIEDWRHSSFHALISDKATHLQRKTVNEWFGGKEQLKIFHNQVLKEKEKLELEFT